ncbi:MAG: hypothetical protein HKN70_07130, partial [Gammaproteobacteria bacterium]|nr:hypothetical protein [Gammaproteobacteria bacterium]
MMSGFTRFIVGFVSVLLLNAANSAVPDSLSYQAYLTDETGAAINATTSITFSIYNVDAGGSPLWTETLPVVVNQGLLSVELGNASNPFPQDLFDTPLWVGINVADDGEMTPRRRLTTAGFAFTADNALGLQGQGPAAFDQSADIANLQSQLTAALASIAALEASLATATATITTLQADVTSGAGNIAALQSDVTAIQSDVALNASDITTLDSSLSAEASARTLGDDALTAALATVQSNSVPTLDGVLSLSGGDTAYFNGVNVQIVNGLGSTPATNGLGNLIVGYNLSRTTGDPV